MNWRQQFCSHFQYILIVNRYKKNNKIWKISSIQNAPHPQPIIMKISYFLKWRFLTNFMCLLVCHIFRVETWLQLSCIQNRAVPCCRVETRKMYNNTDTADSLTVLDASFWLIENSVTWPCLAIWLVENTVTHAQTTLGSYYKTQIYETSNSTDHSSPLSHTTRSLLFKTSDRPQYSVINSFQWWC